MKTRKEMRTEIKDFVSGLNEGQLSFGSYVTSIGSRYVHGFYYDCVGNFHETKMKIEEFYMNHCYDPYYDLVDPALKPVKD